MKFSEYRIATRRTRNNELNLFGKVEQSKVGILCEAVEVLDVMKKHEFQGLPVDEDAMIKELGDICWYVAQLCDLRGVSEGKIDDVIFMTDAGWTPSDADFLYESSRSLVRVAYSVSENDSESMVLSLVRQIIRIADILGVSMGEVLQRNIDKLNKRFPEGFNTDDSIKRVDTQEV